MGDVILGGGWAGNSSGLVIITGRWTWQMATCWGAGRKASTAALEQACRESTAWLADRCRKAIILSQDPILPIEDAADNGPEIWKLFRDNPNSLPKFSEDCAAREARQLSASLLRRAADPRVLIVDGAAPFQNSDGSIRYFTSAGALYRDNQHLNPLGAMELKPLLEPYFLALAP